MSKTFWDGRVLWLLLAAFHFLVFFMVVNLKDASWGMMQSFSIGFCTAAFMGRLK